MWFLSQKSCRQNKGSCVKLFRWSKFPATSMYSMGISTRFELEYMSLHQDKHQITIVDLMCLTDIISWSHEFFNML
jgi:hypothetical protein